MEVIGVGGVAAGSQCQSEAQEDSERTHAWRLLLTRRSLSLVEEGLPRGAGKGRLQSVVVRHEIHKPSRVLLAQGGLQREIPQVQEVQQAGEAEIGRAHV